MKLCTAALALIGTLAMASPDPAADAPTTAPIATTQISPDAQKLLDQSTAAYRAVRSMSLQGQISTDLNASGQIMQNTAPFSAAYQCPNQFHHQVKDDALLGATGKSVYVYLPGDNRFMQVDIAANDLQAAMARSIGQILGEQDPSLMMALIPQPMDVVLSGATDISRAADTQLDGRPYPTLHAVYSNEHRITDYAFDPDTHLLRQARSDLRGRLEAGGAANVVKAILQVDFTHTATGSAAPTTQFAWQPPAGAKPIAEGGGSGGGGGDDTSPATALVGKPAPPLALAGMDGKTVTLAEQKGSVVLLDFWAIFCPPCRALLPHTDELAKDLAPRGVKVFAVNLGDDKDAVRVYMNDNKLTLPMLLDANGAAAQAYLAQAIPQTVVIGKDGIVRNVFVGYGPGTEQQIHDAIEAALK